MRHKPPTSQPRPEFQQFTERGRKHRQRWPVKIRSTPSSASFRLTSADLSVCRHTDGCGVTTVTSHPERARYFAMFQVRVQAVNRAGGKGFAKKSSFGAPVPRVVSISSSLSLDSATDNILCLCEPWRLVTSLIGSKSQERCAILKPYFLRMAEPRRPLKIVNTVARAADREISAIDGLIDSGCGLSLNLGQ
jgi:hypothetical protein